MSEMSQFFQKEKISKSSQQKDAFRVGVAKKNWTIMEITANFCEAKFFNPNDETHFDFLIGWIPRAHTECPASLLNYWAQATWALRVRPGDSSDQKIEMGLIIRHVKLSFLEIFSNFHAVVVTPTEGTNKVWVKITNLR